jgi:ubiquinone/menaquinone biosynthesis C-methylase UbiE
VHKTVEVPLLAKPSSITELTATKLTLSDDAFVVMDPEVEVLDVVGAEYFLLCHTHFEVGMTVPPGEGLLAFLTALEGKPAKVAALRAEFDDQDLIDEMLASLREYGFVYAISQTMPSVEELAQLRTSAMEARRTALRRRIEINLDSATSVKKICAQLDAEATPPELLLHCERLADHRTTLARLAQLRQVGALRTHHTVLQTRDLKCNSETRQSLIRLGVSVNLEGVPWPKPNLPISGLAEMTRHCVAVHACMIPDRSIFDQTVRDRVVSWARSAFISGLCLQIDVDALWESMEVTEDDFTSVFDTVEAFEREFGDIQVTNLPSDDVLLGKRKSCFDPTGLSRLANRFRKAYLRWRIPFLKSCEADNSWSQTPEAEEKVVRLEDDLLPNHPELLELRPGSFVVDVCGGLGRVARRLAPAVGEEGLIISIEMLRCLSERARRVACERRIMNLQFRTGLAQRIPLPDQTVDAAVNEWTGGIWELGIGRDMIKEMTRVVRPGGRVAASHRLVQIPLTELGQAWIQYEKIYDWMIKAFVHPELTILAQRVWGQIVPSLVGENATNWRKQYLPSLINPHDVIYDADENPGVRADVFLTIIAKRH